MAHFRKITVALFLFLSFSVISQSVKWQDIIPYTATAGVANTYTTTISSFTFVTGREIKISWATGNTGAITLAINGGAATDVYVNGAALSSGTISSNTVSKLSYDGTRWNIIGGAGGGGGLTIGSTSITSGTNTRVLYNNAGTLGEYVISGSGNVAMTTSPVFTTPNIGSATGSISGNAGTATILATARTIGTITGDATSAGSSFDGSANNTNALTLATVNGNVGSFGSATQVGVFTVNAKGLVTAASNTTVTPAVGSITGLGTDVATALGVNIGSAGAFVTFNGALGTPSSGTLTNATGLPIIGGTTGTLSVARGGTGLTTIGGTNRLLYTTTTDNISAITTANSSVLVTDGSGVPSWSTALPNGTTATTQSALDNSTKVATTAYVDALSFWKITGTTTMTGTVTTAFGTNPWLLTSSVSSGTGATAGRQEVYNSLTTGNAIDVSTTSYTTGALSKWTSTSTVANNTLGTDGVTQVRVSGANSTSGKLSIGLFVETINTGTTSTNYGIVAAASGATNNYPFVALTSGGLALFRINSTSAGRFELGSGGNRPYISPSTAAGVVANAGADFGILSVISGPGGVNNHSVLHVNYLNTFNTNGDNSTGSSILALGSATTHTATSGAAEFISALINPTFNQTSTSTGSIWDIRIKTVHTSVLGTKYGVDYDPSANTSALHYAWRNTFGFHAWASVLSPAQITSNQNDYNPSGWNGAAHLRLTTDASRNITSLAQPVSGRLAIISNVGTNPLVLKDDDGSSGTAANRFDLPGDLPLEGDESVMFIYDNTTTMWRTLGVHHLFSSTIKGLVPSSGGGTTNYLRADGTWTNPNATNLSGTYTPSLTNTTNITASTAYVTGYHRIGSSVTVYGKVDIDATLAASTATELQMSLPVASNFTAEEDGGGEATSDSVASLTARIKMDATTDKASFVFKAISLTNDSYAFEFSYQVK